MQLLQGDLANSHGCSHSHNFWSSYESLIHYQSADSPSY
jgi:hypothetical protein